MLKPAPADHEIHPLIAGRWSPRAFDPEARLRPEEMARLFEAARWAPSSSNTQPWAYVYGLAGTPAFAALLACLSAGNQTWAGRAAALVVACCRDVADDGRPLGHAEHDLGLSLAMLMVQAEAMGLMTHAMGGFDREKARAALAVPEGWRPKTAIAVGRPGDPALLDEARRKGELGPRQPRRPVTAFAFEGAWPAAE